jgi:uncharacterized protein YegL
MHLCPPTRAVSCAGSTLSGMQRRFPSDGTPIADVVPPPFHNSENAMTEQIVFTTAEFADNPEPRCPCVLLLDVSGSMRGAPINELNAGLTAFKDELAADTLAMKRVEIALITFGPVQIESTFQSAASFYPSTLTSQGDTPMGEAIRQGIELVRQRKTEYRANGIAYYRPWIFLITDGGPTDEWQTAAAAVREGEASKAFAFFAIGVHGAQMETLQQISVRAPLQLDGLRFRELFAWLSASLSSVSRSMPGTDVPLAPPSGWASV